MEDREGQILAALHQHEGWTSRAELARILGRRRLNQADFEALAVLQVTGAIEAEKRVISGPIGYAMYYRAKQ